MGACFECDADGEFNHHVVPKSKGGTRTVVLCARCHAIVHSRRSMASNALTSAALQAKRARGEKTGGTTPFGYRLDTDGKTLVVDAGEQKSLVLIRKLRDQGWTYRAIAAELERRGISTKTGKAAWAHTAVQRIARKTHRWHPQTLKQIIDAEDRHEPHTDARAHQDAGR